jgi:large subunit ribosomal protein L23
MRSRPRPKRYVRKLEARKPCVHGEPGIELRPYQVIIRPLITEKGTHLTTRTNSYVFMVSPLANKTQIKEAVQELFNVRVEKVNTQTRKGDKTRFKQILGKTADIKKAIVTLHEEDRIDFV